MEIVLHAHHANVSESLKRRTEAALRRIATRMHRVANAIVRFVHDGPTRRVEIILHGTGTRSLFAQADGPHFAPALTIAMHRLESQIDRVRRRRTRRHQPHGDRHE